MSKDQSDGVNVNYNASSKEIRQKRKEISRAIVRRAWPLLFAQIAYAFVFSGFLLNILQLSYIFWEDSIFHAFEMGLVVGVQNWAIAFVGIFLGRLVDRFSRKKLMIFMMITSAIGRGFVGLIPTGESYTYPLLLLCMGIAGFGRGGFMPVIVSLTNDLFEPHERSQFFAIFESISQVFNIIGMVLSTALIQYGYWRFSFFMVGIVLLCATVTVSIYFQDPKRGLYSQKDLTQVLQNEDKIYAYQLNRENIRKTIFTPTNIMAFLEGIFTWLILANTMYLIYPYIQSPPNNISPVMTSLIMTIFGVPGAIFGAIAFGRLSDRLGVKNLKYRILLIVLSLFCLLITVIVFFTIPLPELSPEQGNTLRIIVRQPALWIIALMIFFMRAVMGIYNINQNPILQAVNLPEAQGQVTAWGQFLETIAMGLGPTIAGIILTYYSGNYAITGLILVLLGLPGPILWLFALRFINRDHGQIQEILRIRAIELQQTDHSP
jgi:MFS family permease